jgi:hypothetical protein
VLSKRSFYASLLSLILCTAFSGINGSVPAHASDDPILNSAGNFQLLAGGALTLGASLTGLDPTYSGTSASAVVDLTAAIATLSGASATPISAGLGGKTYTPGAYVALAGTAFTMASNIILDGENDCNSKFYFVTPAAMNTTAGISITLINDAIASNVYWVAGGAITIGASGNLAGNFLSGAAITVGASTTVNGRFLATAALTVGASTIFDGYPLVNCSRTEGALSITAPSEVEIRGLTPGENRAFDLGEVTVSDSRGSGASWVVESQYTPVPRSTGGSLRGDFFTYDFKDLLSNGGAVLTSYPLNSLLTSQQVLTATTGTSVNGATWIPVITVLVPEDQLPGKYIGSIIHSVY